MTSTPDRNFKHVSEEDLSTMKEGGVPDEIIESVDKMIMWEEMSAAERIGRQLLGYVIIGVLILGALVILGMLTGA